MSCRLILLFILCCAACETPTDTARTITASINIVPDPVPALQLGLPFQMVVAATG
jgi:hypothetical protein